MSNPLFNQQFPQFMMHMRGQNPTQIIDSLLLSGQLNQGQLNQAIQQARQMEKQFEQFRGMFGFRK